MAHLDGAKLMFQLDWYFLRPKDVVYCDLSGNTMRLRPSFSTTIDLTRSPTISTAADSTINTTLNNATSRVADSFPLHFAIRCYPDLSIEARTLGVVASSETSNSPRINVNDVEAPAGSAHRRRTIDQTEFNGGLLIER